MARGRPGRRRSASPSTPSVANWARHIPTVGLDSPSSAAISVLVAPSAARSTIRARWAIWLEVDGVRVSAVSSLRCPSDNSITAAALDTPGPYHNWPTYTSYYWNGALAGRRGEEFERDVVGVA